MTSEPAARIGRPAVTTHAWIEQVAFDLFQDRGFEATTVQAIADAAGIGRRTLFRYFDSKNDIPWGRFEDSLASLRATLDEFPHDVAVCDAVQRGVLEFNRLDEGAVPQHRTRMRLILRTPALQAHSALRYAEWRSVIAGFVSSRVGVPPDSLLPRTVGQVSLALAVSAYEDWLDHDDASLPDLLDAAMSELRGYLGVDRARGS